MDHLRADGQPANLPRWPPRFDTAEGSEKPELSEVDAAATQSRQNYLLLPIGPLANIVKKWLTPPFDSETKLSCLNQDVDTKG